MEFICVVIEPRRTSLRTLLPDKKGSGGLMVKVSASQPLDREFEPYMGHDDTSTGWFQEAHTSVIQISCENLHHDRAKINNLKLSDNILKIKIKPMKENALNYFNSNPARTESE